MSQSNSNLLNYVSLLLSDDEALKTFLVDPITRAEGKHGLSKAERAVLRRTVAHLANTSLNGFSMERNLSSYRRSLRLLQNVLHTSGAGLAQGMLSNGPLQDGYTVFYLYVYYPNVNPGVYDFTCQSNTDVNNIGGPYGNYQVFQIVFGSGDTTVERLILGASQAFPDVISYKTVSLQSKPYLSEITINGRTITADLSNSCYDLDANPNADAVFWFYTLNGAANRGGTSGSIGESFSEYPLKSGDVVFLQLIAPDASYGFQSCAPHELNAYAKK